MYTAVLAWAQRRSPAVVAGLAAFLLGLHDALAIDLNLDSGLDEAGSEMKRYLKKGLQIAALITSVVGLGVVAWKFNQKDREAVWYLAGTLIGAGIFVGAGALLG